MRLWMIVALAVYLETCFVFIEDNQGVRCYEEIPDTEYAEIAPSHIIIGDNIYKCVKEEEI